LGFSLASAGSKGVRLPKDRRLSIPVTWDFLLHHGLSSSMAKGTSGTFNSRYLGFSLASPFCGSGTTLVVAAFNSRYLGFSLASSPLKSTANTTKPPSFNSRYLGFSLASYHTKEQLAQQDEFFQFPLLGIFSCILPLSNANVQLEKVFQFPLLGIFSCILALKLIQSFDYFRFQFPLLGIFSCIVLSVFPYFFVH